MELPVPGPDGFLISPSDPLRAAHLRLNDYLLAEEQRSPSTPDEPGLATALMVEAGDQEDLKTAGAGGDGWRRRLAQRIE